MRKFTKDERSTWPYFWAHWMAFQMTAINLRVWKFKYLFHDWYKPWLKMFGVSYKKIQKFHKTQSNHHLEHLDICSNPHKFDWEELIIDWECSQYTKEACPRNAREEMEFYLSNNLEDRYIKYCLDKFMRPKLDQLGL